MMLRRLSRARLFLGQLLSPQLLTGTSNLTAHNRSLAIWRSKTRIPWHLFPRTASVPLEERLDFSISLCSQHWVFWNSRRWMQFSGLRSQHLPPRNLHRMNWMYKLALKSKIRFCQSCQLSILPQIWISITTQGSGQCHLRCRIPGHWIWYPMDLVEVQSSHFQTLLGLSTSL